MFYLLLAAVAAVIVVLDQITKALVVANIPLDGYVEAIPGLFHLTYIRNTGASASPASPGRLKPPVDSW